MAVLRSAYANAGVPPHEVDYVEAHGTGTPLGDPIEARALGTVLGRGRADDAPLLIGTVKSNLGHLEAAAGMAGFIKAVLAVQKGRIPANLHFQTPNPHIPFDQLRLKVVAEQQDWPQTDRPRRAGVSSFGFGGTNAHVVIEQAPAAGTGHAGGRPGSDARWWCRASRRSGSPRRRARWRSGCRVRALTCAARRGPHPQPPPRAPPAVRHRLRPRPRPGDGWVAGAGRRPVRRAPMESSARTTGRAGPARFSCIRGRVRSGPAWAGSCWPTSRCSPRRSPSWSRCSSSRSASRCRQIIADGESVSGDAQVQPVLMGLQLALTELWRSYGVHPGCGHRPFDGRGHRGGGRRGAERRRRAAGDRHPLAADVAAGRPGRGRAARSWTPRRPRQLIADYPERRAWRATSRRARPWSPACPTRSTRSSPRCSAQNTFARRVNMEVASHTALMDPILPELRSALGEI